jgi:hypothetical protein
MKLLDLAGEQVQVADRILDKGGVFRYVYALDPVYDQHGNDLGTRAARLDLRAVLAVYPRAMYKVLREF